MTNFLLRILVIFIALVIHETGHFLAGKILNYGIEEYCIGIGPKLFQKKKKDIIYTFRLLPIAAFVTFKDDCDDKRDLTKPDIMNFFVMPMGIIFNFILAIFSLILIFFLRGYSISETFIISMNVFVETLKPFLFNLNNYLDSCLIINIPDCLQIFNDIDFIFISIFWVNINVGFLNLLPLPILDGGRIIINGIELIIKREIPTIIIDGINALLIMSFGIFVITKLI